MLSDKLYLQVVWAVINTQRHMEEYLEHQRKKSWCGCLCNLNFPLALCGFLECMKSC